MAGFARRYPFHARFLASWTTEATDVVSTMGVTVRHARIKLLFSPSFVADCSFDELAGVLLHEVHHVLFEHVFLDASHFPDAHALLIATEVTANEHIRESLPGRPITL